MENFATKTILAHGSIAFFGALVHASNAHRAGNSKTFGDFMLLIIMSSFTGVIFALLGLHIFGQDTYLTLATAGTGGFLGVEGMTLVVKKVQQLIAGPK